jgi:hypothetical protein
MNSEEMTMGKALLWGVLLVVGVFVVLGLPDIKRYLRMRNV